MNPIEAIGWVAFLYWLAIGLFLFFEWQDEQERIANEYPPRKLQKERQHGDES